MKNKLTLTVTSNEYKVVAVLDGQKYCRHMKRDRNGRFTEQAADCPDIEQMDNIDDVFPDVIGCVMRTADDYADLLNEFEEMDE